MKKLALIAPLFLLVACERASFDGQMNVSTSFQIDGKKESVTVPVGKHEVKRLLFPRVRNKIVLDLFPEPLI